MGEMNAMGHLLAVSASPTTDRLWDFCQELSARYSDSRSDDAKRSGPLVHGFPPPLVQEVVDEGGPVAPRWCVHPVRGLDVECQDDSLDEALLKACVWLAQELPTGDLWRRS